MNSDKKTALISLPAAAGLLLLIFVHLSNVNLSALSKARKDFLAFEWHNLN